MRDRIVVKDANILIDLINGDLLERWTELKIETWITEAVLAEILDEAQCEILEQLIQRNAIKVETISDQQGAEWLIQVSEFSKKHRISFADSASISCAMTLRATLITGDWKMRKAAKVANIEVRGLLWVLDLLVEEEVISGEEACQSLTTILDEGARLPKAECEKRLKSWADMVDWSDL